MNKTLKDLWKYSKNKKQNESLVNETLKDHRKYDTKQKQKRIISH